jgi:hypothetical protein
VPEHVAVSERLQALLEAHSYALVRVTAGALEVLLEAEVGAVRFFSQPTAWEAKHAGPGGRVGQQYLWSCGFTPAGRTANSGTSSAIAPDAPSWPLVEAALLYCTEIYYGRPSDETLYYIKHLFIYCVARYS